MDRIAIIGCGGSGKTTVGRRLSELLNVPITHLDVIYYDDRWNTLAPDKFASIQEELVAEPRWIIDGNFASTLPIRLKAADTVIFLDIPARTCLLGILQRRLGHGGGQHDVTGVYDRVTWQFIKYVWHYRRSMAPRVRTLIADHAGHARIHVLTSRAQANRFLTQIETPPPRS